MDQRKGEKWGNMREIFPFPQCMISMASKRTTKWSWMQKFYRTYKSSNKSLCWLILSIPLPFLPWHLMSMIRYPSFLVQLFTSLLMWPTQQTANDFVQNVTQLGIILQIVLQELIGYPIWVDNENKGEPLLNLYL